MGRSRRGQSGAAGWVVLVVIAAAIWWQWDWIAGLFGGSSGTVAEVTNFSCTSQAGRSTIEGTVRNLSAAPIGLRAVAAVNDTSGRILEGIEAGVRPSPLPPQQSGGFRADGPAIPEGGSCKLRGIVDADTGMPVSHRRR